MNLLTKFLALASLALLAGYSYATEESAELVKTESEQTALVENKPRQKWYRVEVIIFTQKDVFGDELSSRDIVLTYPENLIDLDNNNAAYTALAKSKLELGPDAYSLERTGVYKVLFHKAWRQPGLAPEKAPWIYVDAPAPNEDKTLNGSLRVYLSSYLHFDSNLWLASYANGEQPLNERELGLPELGLPKLELETPLSPAGLPQEEASIPALPPWPRPPENPLAASPLINTEAINTEAIAIDPGTGNISGQLTGSSASIAEITERQAVLEPLLPAIEEIILLKQSSRLKLDKLHYFDHPKMGLLIKVSRAAKASLEQTGTEQIINEASAITGRP
ncbi:MAG: hypothetical protein KBT88_03030 [Gammaproteobacteria bacterium]|nr:hypothetical protein [Gammaproteobacteria bacterium]MBQ0838732.1 hypothetical protein [Gammaproteobacteria bacterium]